MFNRIHILVQISNHVLTAYIFWSKNNIWLYISSKILYFYKLIYNLLKLLYKYKYN